MTPRDTAAPVRARRSLAIRLRPPWYVRLLGAAVVAADVYTWLGDHTAATKWDVIKHIVLLFIGLLMFYPEAVAWVHAKARRLPWLDRRHYLRGGE